MIAVRLLFIAGYLMLFCQREAQAQPALPHVFHLTEKDGLDARFASTLVEDKQRSLIWIGSQSGIWRYDGESFLKVYPHQEKGRLSTDTYLNITLFMADTRGDIWFYDERNCIKRLSHITGNIEAFYVRSERQDSNITFKPTFYIGGMHEDRRGRIWANTDSHGLVLFDPQNGCFAPASMSLVLEPAGHTGKIYEDAEGWFWFSHNLKPVRYHPETGEVWYQKNNPRQWPIFDLYASVFFVDSRQKMWLSELGDNGYQYDLKTHQFKKMPELYHTSGFVEDSLGRVWFGRYYDRTLNCYDPSSDRFLRYTSNRDDPQGLHIGLWIAWVHLDVRGNLWALDAENINVFNPVKEPVLRIFKEDLYKGSKSLPLGEVSDVYAASDGRYYVCYWMQEGGVVVLDSNFQVQEKWFWHERQPDHRLGFWNSVEDNEGNIWMARQTGWLHIYNIKTRQHSTIHCPEFNGSSPYRAIKDSDGNLWWGLWWGKGFVKWDCRTRKFTNFLVPGSKGMVFNFIEEAPNLLWLATEVGIVKFDRQAGQILKIYPPPFTDPLHPVKEAVAGLVKVTDSTLVGGCMAGIFEFNLKTEQFRLIRFKSGERAPKATVAMVMDAEGYIYYGYTGGMVRFHPYQQDLRIIPLSELVGFPFQTHFFSNPLPNGRIAFSANDRFVVLDIAALENETPVARPRVTLFSVDGDSSVLGRDVERSVCLRYNENYFTLHFSSFALPDLSVYYSYRLKGLKDEWSEASPVPSARFTNVPPGTYVFEVRAQLANGSPTEVTAFPFEIRPPFWQTWWFILLAVVAIALLVRFVFRYHLRQHLEKEAIRQRIARDLHDEMGSTLSSISILSEAALHNLQADIDRARFGVIGDRTRQVMDAMSDIVWSVNPRNDNMEKVLQRMKEFAVEILEAQGIHLHFEANESVNSLKLPMEKRKDFYLLFKEAVNNAAKYSGARDVWATVLVENDSLTLEVRDNGRGFDPDTVKQGNGLWNMQRRAERMGGELEIFSHLSEGVCVRLSLVT